MLMPSDSWRKTRRHRKMLQGRKKIAVDKMEIVAQVERTKKKRVATAGGRRLSHPKLLHTKRCHSIRRQHGGWMQFVLAASRLQSSRSGHSHAVYADSSRTSGPGPEMEQQKLQRSRQQENRRFAVCRAASLQQLG